MQLGSFGQLTGQPAHLVVPQRQHVQAGAAAQLHGDAAQPIAVHIQVGQLLQLAHCARQCLTGSRWSLRKFGKGDGRIC